MIEGEYLFGLQYCFVVVELVDVQFGVLQVGQYVDGVVDFVFYLVYDLVMCVMIGVVVVIEVEMKYVSFGVEECVDYFWCGVGGIQGGDDFGLVQLVYGNFFVLVGCIKKCLD